MKFNKGDRVAHRDNPLRWRGEVTKVKTNGRIRVMLASNNIEVEVGPFVPLKLDVFTDKEIEEMLATDNANNN